MVILDTVCLFHNHQDLYKSKDVLLFLASFIRAGYAGLCGTDGNSRLSSENALTIPHLVAGLSGSVSVAKGKVLNLIVGVPHLHAQCTGKKSTILYHPCQT